MNRASLPLPPGIDDDLGIDREQERVAVGLQLVRIALVHFLVADPVAQILDDGRALSDPAQREYAGAMDGRIADFDHRMCLFHWPSVWIYTAMGALIGG